MLRLSTGDELNNLPMPTVEVEVYHEWWEFDTDTFPPLSLLTFPHHGGILSWQAIVIITVTITEAKFINIKTKFNYV